VKNASIDDLSPSCVLHLRSNFAVQIQTDEVIRKSSLEGYRDATREQNLKELQEELSDVLIWEKAQYSTNEAIIHT
jgi:hypothetical protein